MLDVLITLLAVGACIGGFRLGFVARSAAWLGMVAGVAIGARVAPSLSDRLADGDPGRVLVVTAVTLIASAFVGQLLGQLVGFRFRLTDRGGRAARVDRLAGAASGVVAVVLTVWLLSPALLEVEDWPAEQARDSVLIGAIDDLTPAPPAVGGFVGGFVGQEAWDDIVQQIGLKLDIPPPPSETEPVPADLQQLAVSATVRVTNQGCLGTRRGTGFVVEPGNLVFTNAHVVAGASAGRVRLEFEGTNRDDRSERPGTVVYFDPTEDVAIVAFGARPGAAAFPLAERAAVGDQGWIWGHRGGDDLIRRTFRTHQRSAVELTDIYHESASSDPDTPRYRRDILVVAASLQGGDSGSPLVDANGRVVGMAFAVATDRPDVALAIDVGELHAALRRLELGEGVPARDDGPCLGVPR